MQKCASVTVACVYVGGGGEEGREGHRGKEAMAAHIPRPHGVTGPLQTGAHVRAGEAGSADTAKHPQLPVPGTFKGTHLEIQDDLGPARR